MPFHPSGTRFVQLARKEIGPLAALLVAAALILSFSYLAMEVLEGDTAAFDRAFILALRTSGSLADPIGPAWLEEMGRDATALGSYAFLGFVFFSTLGYLILLRKRSAAVLMTVAVLGGAVLSMIFKLGLDRARPDLPHAARVFTASFPSGHTTLSTVTFLTLGALLTRVHAERRFKIYFMTLAVILTISVGLSRLYLGVHYPTDVLAGWSLGAAWAILCWMVALWLQHQGEIELPSESHPGQPFEESP
ncbi:phosphatase PAP2 family protein [Afifella sp. H1R]|uniref:Undecaprenyl-diphosphatase n=1 Tax=Consotaella salsifontis TaxID=1365950 RepID=A0A1T4TD45_9HYPH|nr:MULTISPECIES: phosphatase PAP2 family protein [Hyphomicrobiales]MCF1505998.1 phosphatase PAP2 family protein [Afifella sp. H1R]SKA38337.1 undecaprenyl-diphosphatase [Consotaella salsifontis]